MNTEKSTNAVELVCSMGLNRPGNFTYKCVVKELKTKPNNGKICRVYKAKEFEE